MKLRAISWASVSSLPQAAEDKISIDEQLRLNAEWCAANNADIVDTLVIPGHSRYESDIIDLLEDYANQGIWAYHRIRDHWKARDFDLLICYHDSRFGRSSTAYNWVGENVIRSGAQIYRINGGWIDRKNAPFQLALGSIAATTGVQQLIEGRKAALPHRAKRGLPLSSQVAMSHILIRDDMGKAIRREVDESQRLMWDDLVRVYVDQRVGYKFIERVMFDQYGHANERGEPYHPLRFYYLLTNPVTHGHSALGIRRGKRTAPIAEWVFKEGYPVPSGVEIYYNTHDPLWTGETFDRIFAEFQRRQGLRGHASPDGGKFTGLVVCGECGYNMAYAKGAYSTGVRCISHYNTSATRPDCTQQRWLHERVIREWLTPRLDALITSRDWSHLLQPDTEQAGQPELAQQLSREIERTQAQLMQLIELQADQKTDTVRALYQQKIDTAGDYLDQLIHRRREVESISRLHANVVHQQEQSLSELIEIQLANFWDLDEARINQILHRLMGNYRLVALDGMVVGTRETPKHPRRRTR